MQAASTTAIGIDFMPDKGRIESAAIEAAHGCTWV